MLVPHHASPARAVSTDEETGISEDGRLPMLIRSLFRPPPAGMIALLRGPNVVISLGTFAAGLYALKGQRVFLVDAGNSTDPYIVSRLALAARRNPREVLSRIHVVRTFTVHQLAALTFRRLTPFIRRHAPGLVILSGATSLFADANVPLREGQWLLQKIAAEMRRQAEMGCKVLVTAADAPVESGRKHLHRPWLDVASRSIRITQSDQGLVLQQEKPFSHRIETLPADQLAAFLR